jgi:hypothetical protein
MLISASTRFPNLGKTCRILSKPWKNSRSFFQALEKPAVPVSNLWSSTARPEILKIMLTKSCAGSMLPYDFVLMILLFL